MFQILEKNVHNIIMIITQLLLNFDNISITRLYKNKQ